MKIKQEKVFKPLTITIETKEEYDALMKIVDEALSIRLTAADFMDSESQELGRQLSNYASNNG